MACESRDVTETAKLCSTLRIIEPPFKWTALPPTKAVTERNWFPSVQVRVVGSWCTHAKGMWASHIVHLDCCCSCLIFEVLAMIIIHHAPLQGFKIASPLPEAVLHF